jgi:thiopurine S-methyltransferase
MQPEFWHAKWRNQEIGFHLTRVNPALIRHWPALKLPPNSRILIPLCGKSLDLIWLRQRGHAVVGIELSPIALDALAQQFEAELGVALKKKEDGITTFEGEGITLLGADFFSLRPEQVGRVDAVYDRAAWVAMPPELRPDYCRQLRLLSEKAPQLLIALDYDQQKMDGPPFALCHSEILHHYQKDHHCILLESQELIEQEPRFRERGLDSFRQYVYHLSPMEP